MVFPHRLYFPLVHTSLSMHTSLTGKPNRVAEEDDRGTQTIKMAAVRRSVYREESFLHAITGMLNAEWLFKGPLWNTTRGHKMDFCGCYGSIWFKTQHCSTAGKVGEKKTHAWQLIMTAFILTAVYFKYEKYSSQSVFILQCQNQMEDVSRFSFTVALWTQYWPHLAE